MRTICLMSVAIMIAWHSPATAQGMCGIEGGVPVRNAFSKAEELVFYPEDDLRTYVRGFTNGFLLAPIQGGDLTCADQAYQCLGGRSDAQLSAILRKYLNEHPETWNSAAAVITYNALVAPCMTK